jgi:hypothetical protein
MILEARASSCWTSTLVLNRDGQPVGTCAGRWFSESRDVTLSGQRELVFEKIGWFSRFVLTDAGSGRPLGAADRSGWLPRSWDLELSVGPAQMVRPGWLAQGYVVKQGDAILARVERRSLWERGWSVTGDAALTEADLLLIGLVYQTAHHAHAH